MLTIGIHGVPDPEGRGRSHDHGVAVVEDGRVVYCQELERHTGRKHDGALSDHFEDLVGPFLRRRGSVQVVLANTFFGCDFASAGGMIQVHGKPDLEVPDMVAEATGRLRFEGTTVPARFWTICHEMAHLGTCLPFFGPFRPNSLLVHIDGGAYRSCASAWHFDGRSIVCLDYGWHAGLKGAVNNFNDSALSRWILGLSAADHLAMPGKLMGLASFGRPDAQAMDWLDEMGWLRSERFSREEVRSALIRDLPHLGFEDFSDRDRGSQILAACMQARLETEVLSYVRTFRDRTGVDHLYYSGGAALNIHANARIERELGFRTVNIPPAPSDAGLALGAAAFVAWRSGEEIQVHSPFLNGDARATDQDSISESVPILRSTEAVVAALADGAIIGVWTGKAEVGPRALGHRSLLARPDSVTLRQRLSEDIKRREWYRPVAPMMLPVVAQESLTGYRGPSALTRYMLGAWPIAPGMAPAFEGCIHVDKTVRAQVVEPDLPELAHIREMLLLLQARYGILGVINTSFNGKGQPIVGDRNDASLAARRLGLDALWLPY